MARCTAYGDPNDTRTRCIFTTGHPGEHGCPDWPTRLQEPAEPASRQAERSALFSVADLLLYFGALTERLHTKGLLTHADLVWIEAHSRLLSLRALVEAAQVDAAHPDLVEARREAEHRLSLAQTAIEQETHTGADAAPLPLQGGFGRCEGRYPVPPPSGGRDEPFEVTFRCGLRPRHSGPHRAAP